MSSRCQHLCLEDFGPGGWQPGFMPRKDTASPLPCCGWLLVLHGWSLGAEAQAASQHPSYYDSSQQGANFMCLCLRAAVRWHYVDYNSCGPDSRSLLTHSLLGHIVSAAICTVVDSLTPGSPQLKLSIWSTRNLERK